MDGTLLVLLHGDDPANLEAASEVTLEGEPGAIPFHVLDVAPGRRQADGRLRVRLQLAGLDSRGRAEAWVGAAVAIPESGLQSLPAGEYYWRDLIGLRCRTRDGRPLGVLRELWPTPAHDVLVVDGGGEPVLLAATDDLLVSIDLAAGEIVVDPPEGLFDPIEAAPDAGETPDTGDAEG
jgi:16S rRNA processing protein RimM